MSISNNPQCYLFYLFSLSVLPSLHNHNPLYSSYLPIYITCILRLNSLGHLHGTLLTCFCSYNGYMLTFEDLGIGASNERDHVSLFWDWVTSLSLIFQSSKYLSANLIILFFFIAEQYLIVCLYHVLIIHSPVEGDLGCFHYLAIEDKAAVNSVEQVFGSNKSSGLYTSQKAQLHYMVDLLSGF